MDTHRPRRRQPRACNRVGRQRPLPAEPHGGCVDYRTESLVILQVHDQPGGCPRPTLEADLDDLDPDSVADSIDSLERTGLILITLNHKREVLYPSAQLSRLVALHLIAF